MTASRSNCSTISTPSAADAGGALDRDAQPSLFDRLDWFRLVAAHCPPPGRLARRAGARRRPRRPGCSSPSTAAEAERLCRLVFAALRRRSAIATSDVMTPIAAALRDARHRRGRARRRSRIRSRSRAAFRAAGWLAVRHRRRPATGGSTRRARISTAYWATRPGQLRNTAKRKAKAAGLDIEIHDRFDAAAWADYEAVYAASWKPEEGSLRLPARAGRAGGRGRARCGSASPARTARPVAAQLWLVENGTRRSTSSLIARMPRRCRPAPCSAWRCSATRSTRTGSRAIDYGTGDDGYKRDWMGERRPLWRLEAFNPRTLRGLARRRAGRDYRRLSAAREAVRRGAATRGA